MKKILLLLTALTLLLPGTAKALLFVPTGRLTIITNTSLDGVFDYQFKEGVYPFDEIDSFQALTTSGTSTYSYNFLAAFPTKYRISQNTSSEFDLTVNCTSTLGVSPFSIAGNEARITLTMDDEVTCVFNNIHKDQKNSLLIIPGIMGTEMFKGDEKLWADSTRMVLTPNDRFMDNLAYDPSVSPVDSTVKPDKIISREATLNYTEKLITDLHTQGYTDNQNLFLFPYDWRRELSSTANNELKNKLDEILAANSGKKIDILAHSQGGLVIKKLLFDHPQYQNKIDKLIFVGTPHLGAPKAAKALLYGDSMNVSFLGMGLDPEEIKRIGLHMPSVYELLPSEEYFNHYSGYLGEARRDNVLSDWQATTYNKAQTNASLANNGLDANLIHTADNFHNSSLDNLDFSTTNIKAYNIVGCQQPTLIGIFKKAGGNHSLGYFAGDGTVPVKSANNVYGTKTYFALNTEHGTMLTRDGTRQQITNLLSGNEAIPNTTLLTTDPSECHFNGEVVSVHSPVKLDIYDALGNHTGRDENGNIEIGIPESQYDEIGEEKFVFLPDGEHYQVKLTGTGNGTFDLYDDKIDENGTVSSSSFLSLPVTPTTQGEIIYESNQPILKIDAEGDGNFEQTFTPNILSGEEAEDLLPPTTTINLAGTEGNTNHFRTNVSVSLNAEDTTQTNGSPSGILKTLWRATSCPDLPASTKAWQDYSSPILFNAEGVCTIEYYSLDKAGNQEDTQSKTFYVDKTPPEINLDFDTTKKDLSITSTENSPVEITGPIIKTKDESGNTTEIKINKTLNKSSLTGSIQTIAYNNVVTTPTTNYFKFEWEQDKLGKLKKLEQKIQNKNNFEIHSEFNGKNTIIEGKDSKGEFHSSFVGLKLLRITTNKGLLNWTIQP